MKEIGLHPEDLSKDLFQGHGGAALFYIQEGLAKDKLRWTYSGNRMPCEGLGKFGHRMNEPSYP